MRKHGPFICFLVLWLGGNLLFLERFPFVHSDEPWLAGLTRAMLESGSLNGTEPFFDLKPRFPHAIKSLFHLLQMPFLQIFGYGAFSFRLLSLLGGAGCLILFHALALRLAGSGAIALLASVLLGVDIQFIYASHFARQEILVLLAMLACFLLLARPSGKPRAVAAAVITGLCIGVHPNAFILAAMCGALFLVIRSGWRPVAAYAGITGLFAAAFVGISLAFDPDFFRHYFAFGSEFLIDSSLPAKIRETGPYFQRLYYRVSGTYYTPDIRPQLVLFLFVTALSAIAAIRSGRRFALPLAALFGIWAGMALVGRFSQPYVIFFFPFCYLLLTALLQGLGKTLAPLCLCACIGLAGWLCAAQVWPVATQPFQYEGYLANIAAAVPPGAKTIGNLNAGYHFANGALRDYRNLPYLKKNGLSFADYARDNAVEYVIVSDELRFLYERRPVWNGIYGTINFLPEMEEYLRTCALVRTFTDNQYGVRVTRFQNGGRDFAVRIYHCPRP
ncbi:conserved membrane hypothetical protein [uncultured delta proteobacterium]|uniref:Glycosyltransferase RgtA/B/C/D-like domain-containing protein n=1 Tax=uncultured delta proteobacterium TaxID=34034 RepID=A0A212KA38_9DELT|nr:conserved membrane hypothetical protein [uncultured delta proteobacterium]